MSKFKRVVKNFTKIHYSKLTSDQKQKVWNWYDRSMVEPEKNYTYWFDDKGNVDCAT